MGGMKQNSLPGITAKRHTLTIETDEGYLVTGIPGEAGPSELGNILLYNLTQHNIE